VVRGAALVGVVSRQGIIQALRHGGNGYIQAIIVARIPGRAGPTTRWARSSAALAAAACL